MDADLIIVWDGAHHGRDADLLLTPPLREKHVAPAALPRGIVQVPAREGPPVAVTASAFVQAMLRESPAGLTMHALAVRAGGQSSMSRLNAAIYYLVKRGVLRFEGPLRARIYRLAPGTGYENVLRFRHTVTDPTVHNLHEPTRTAPAASTEGAPPAD